MSIDQPVLDTASRRDGRSRLMRYFDRFEEGRVIRAAFYGMLIGTVAVVAIDFRDMVERNGGLFPTEVAGSETAVTVPVLPPAVDSDNAGGGVDPRPFLKTDQQVLRDQMKFSLGAGGVLKAQGSIAPGSAERFAAEVEARGEYVRTIALDSPGGSLEDAMRMAKLIRAKGFATEVADGALCASSCPLVLAGGKERKVGEKAAVGLHQFYAMGRAGSAPEQVMADAQITTARISRLLIEFGVDPAVWLHALDTPPRSLYYLSRDEMTKYRLTSGPDRLALRGVETRSN